ncbi:MAG: hypothetical protein NTZ17_07710 [Phycisphaerae bacterium]|nr:hypothetical protein [Phycisphaerae bacterium]
MGKARICLDLDNVLARTDEVMRSVILAFTGGSVDLQYEDVVTFNYWECKDRRGNQISRMDWSAIHRVFSEERHILSIKPYEGIQDHLTAFRDKFDLHIVTSRLRSARKPTVEWLDINSFPEHSLHFVRHGEKHTVLAQFAVSVEDDLAQAEAFAAQGVQSYVLAHPWNEVNGESLVRRMSDWATLREHVLNLPGE